MTELADLIQPLKHIAIAAGHAILDVYNSAAPLEVTDKADDSPLTKADLAAHHVIMNGLNALPVSYPVLSEEGGLPDFATRQQWTRYWLVDPLDGTKEFISRNGEFTVNIALIDNGEAVLGVVYVPVQDTLYVGGVGIGAFKEVNGQSQPIQVRPLQRTRTLNVVGSRRHGAEELDALLQTIAPQFAGVELVNMGSSLKIRLVSAPGADQRMGHRRCACGTERSGWNDCR
jgi:3'(2'), 5'-bisphosphate nucleotidase